MFGRRKDDEDPFSALKDGATYHSTRGAMRSRFRISAARINYMVAFWFPDLSPEWEVFEKDAANTAFSATLSGAQLRRSG
jgi:hypothetical protein